MSQKASEAASVENSPDTRSDSNSNTSAVPQDCRDELVSKIKEANASWRSGVAQMQQQEADFALRLARCRNPLEAVGVCSEWMASCIDSAVAMQHHFLDLWLRAVPSTTRQSVVEKEEHGSRKQEE